MTFEQYGINIRGKTSGNVKTTCPKCGGKTDLSVNVTEGIWKCHKPRCGWTGSLHFQNGKEKTSTYVRPAWINNTLLPDKIVQWFSKRGISQQTLIQAKVTAGEEYMPQVKRVMQVIQFNYFRDEQLVNVKTRDGMKNFKLVANAELIFYNLDAIKDHQDIVIVEGEIEVLSYMEAGVINVISVPNGATRNSKLEYLDNCWQYFEGDKKFYLAVDKDTAGQALQAELLRRLDGDKCYQVDLKDCKDPNEFLVKYGKDELARTITEAKPFPLKGIVFPGDLKVEFDDLYEHGLKPGAKIKIECIDKLISFEQGQLTTIIGTPSSGKALWIETPVPTPDGIKNMGDLQVGDKVFDENGNLCNVTGVTEVMYGRPCYKVTFGNGETVICDEEHLWLTDTCKSRRSHGNVKRSEKRRMKLGRPLKKKGTVQTHLRTFASIKTTKHISETVKAKNDHRNNHSVKLAAPINLPEKLLPIHPYLLGAWLGDGTSSAPSITCAYSDIAIIDFIKSFGYTIKENKSTNKNSGLFRVKGLLETLRQNNLLNNKHIPMNYLRASFIQRLMLLQGLMDTDGYISAEAGLCEFCNTNYTIANSAYQLICSLGMKASFNVGEAKLYGRVTSLKYRILFSPLYPIFTLKRKLGRIKLSKRFTHRAIVSCEKVESVPVKCISVDSPSRLYLCTNAFIPTHNSYFLDFMLARLAILHHWRTCLFSPEHYPIRLHMARMAEQLVGKPFNGEHRMSYGEKNEALAAMNEYFSFIRPDDEMFALDNILELSKSMILRYGIKAIVIDPWNRIEHQMDKGMNETTYIGRQLDKLTNFKQKYDVHIFLVVHPTKMRRLKDSMKYEIPTLYDASGSANFFNKTDNGICVYRDFEKNHVKIIIQKIKYRHIGRVGEAEFTFNQRNGRYTPLNSEDDNSNYLVTKLAEASENGFPVDKYVSFGQEEPDSSPPF